jgi:hypothetical protein
MAVECRAEAGCFKGTPDEVERGGMRDPGLDRHEWETAWQALEAELEDSPGETLPEVGDLIERIRRRSARRSGTTARSTPS